MIRKTKKYFLLLVVCSLIGYIALVVTYILPTDSIVHNVLVTSKNYSKEGNYPNVIINNDASKIGNNTDELMLLESIYDGPENPFIKAINVSRNEIYNNDYWYSLYNLDKVLKGTEFTQTTNYPRYWHGYLIVLRPLLTLFNHDQIKYLNFIIQTILLILVISLMKKRNLNKYIIPFVISICFIYPFVISLTMSFSIVYYLMLLSLIALLKYWEKISSRTPIFFYLIGILTCYFDYFTWPLVTLGIPLLFTLIIKKRTLKESMLEMIKCSITWLVGYSLMWLMKFGIGTLITGQNIFADGIQQAIYRSSAFDNSYSYMMDSINYNLKNMLMNRVNILIFAVILILLIVQIIKNKPKLSNIKNVIPLFLISLFPVGWILIVTNHTFVHYWMVYRIFIITVFGLQSSLIYLCDEK